jgi:hypothetical protein
VVYTNKKYDWNQVYRLVWKPVHKKKISVRMGFLHILTKKEGKLAVRSHEKSITLQEVPRIAIAHWQ